MQLDHIVILVNNLEQAVADYTAQEFTVSPGGTHAGGISHNALIHFQDGTFLELLELRATPRTSFLRRMHEQGLLKAYQQSAKYGMAHRFYGRALDLRKHQPQAEGITDFCLLVSNQTHAHLKDRLPLTPPFGASRKRPDGKTVHWQMYTPIDNDVLPFFRTDYQPKMVRPPEALQHANGALGIHKVCVYIDDYAQVVQSYRQLLPEVIPNTSPDTTLFELANGSIEIINAVTTTRTYEMTQAQAKGIGRFGVVLNTDEGYILM
ncbi:VOC family protein [uncultured Microscilla sp.]|uniref:VOC family protein n=1 Tax=uncultured Microscilla sp. TaxID=432653 RepID=UPI002618E38B|nr:VOC family protein [uncultured Microscilla sp.]